MTQKRTFSFPDETVFQLNRICKEEHTTFSAQVAWLIQEKYNRMFRPLIEQGTNSITSPIKKVLYLEADE